MWDDAGSAVIISISAVLFVLVLYGIAVLWAKFLD
jgi:hypothetical protein